MPQILMVSRLAGFTLRVTAVPDQVLIVFMQGLHVLFPDPDPGPATDPRREDRPRHGQDHADHRNKQFGK